MKISAVFATYNVEKEIVILLDSLLASTILVDEVCICDDRSTDRTLEVIDSYRDRFTFRVTQNEVNSGVTATRNAAWAQATCPLILMLDPDIRMYPDTIERLLAVMDSSGADVVTGGYTDVALDKSWFSQYYALFAHHSFLVANAPFEYNVFNAWCALSKAEVLQAVGGFGEIERGVEIENELLGRRIVAKGFKLLLDPSNCVDHHWGGYRKLRFIFTSRVYWWVKTYFADGLQFEDAMTTSSYGFASLALPAAVATLPLGLVSPAALVIPGALFAGFLAGYAPFYRFVFSRRGTMFTIACIGVSGYFSFFVTASALRSAIEEVIHRFTSGEFTLSYQYAHER